MRHWTGIGENFRDVENEAISEKSVGYPQRPHCQTPPYILEIEYGIFKT
jgi:hypothetical protein